MLASLRHRGYKQALLRRLDGTEPNAELPTSGQAEQRFIEAMFVTMGRLAKLDGQVTRDEIEFANQVMLKLGLHNGAREHAIACFNLGKQHNTDVMQYLTLLTSSIGKRNALAYQFLRTLCLYAQLKGVIQLQEKILLRDCAETLGYDKAELLEICAQQTVSESARTGPLSSVLRDAYGTLQIEVWVDDSEVRKAYLRLMSRYHPDKIRSANLTHESLRFAQEQSMAVRAAYETVCGFRKLRA
ncbi:MAG: hypothetical protein EXR84_03980 [Gammaproteobacteria bacterium]|nr:hypothetical protein [Gammaproteobacteria bacterium]